MKPKIYVTRKLPQSALNKLSTVFELFINSEDRVLNKAEIIRNIKGCDALLCLLTDSIDADIMNACPELKVISNYAVGHNNIDMKEANRRKIPVCFTPGVLTETTADLTFALILAAARRTYAAEKFTREGRFHGWAPELFLGTDVYGKTIGIVGMGRIGAAVARRAAGFGMRILYTKRSSADSQMDQATQVDLKQLLQESDFVSLHLPYSEQTHHLIALKELRLMKRSGFLINTARGAIVDEKALVEALKDRTIAGAALDVFEKEPAIEPELLKMDQVVLLPHIGSATLETRTKMGILAAENAIAVLQGTPPHAIVNPEVLAETRKFH